MSTAADLSEYRARPKERNLSIDSRAAGAQDFAVADSPRIIPEVKIGLLPVSALYGKRSKSAEEAKALQIRQELAMSGEERVELAFRLGERRSAP